jgi:hypothetical protein
MKAAFWHLWLYHFVAIRQMATIGRFLASPLAMEANWPFSHSLCYFSHPPSLSVRTSHPYLHFLFVEVPLREASMEKCGNLLLIRAKSGMNKLAFKLACPAA